MSRPPIHLTAAEAAEILRIKPYEASALCKSGALKATKPGLKWLIDPADLAAYLAAHSNTQDAA